MEQYLHLAIATLATLFPITNPLGNAAIFISITENFSDSERRNQALKGCIYMFIIISVFFIGGSYIMKIFGLSLEGIRIAGGLVIAKIGFNLLKPKREDTHSEEEHLEAKEKNDISFSPLAMPLLAGPGAIASVMGMASLIPNNNMISYLAVSIGILISCIICWLVLRESELIMKILGVNGANALTKIMGFILLCIGVQLIIDGYLSLK